MDSGHFWSFLDFSLEFTFSNFAHRIASQLVAEAAVRPEVGGVEALLLFETVDIPDFAGNRGEIAVG